MPALVTLITAAAAGVWVVPGLLPWVLLAVIVWFVWSRLSRR
ncbi:putative membrane protein [Synechococcus sp. RS9909]|nr:hypothetical protein RS9917_09606 [Synechococcus sp. RS9917]QNI80045.1 putative membrane protein [Synechococcus sp. RS9909]